jgi:poly [ADP-ribose] polymerase
MQVNIGANNNKFYRGQVVCAGGQFWSWTRWGRVGEQGQNALAGPFAGR